MQKTLFFKIQTKAQTNIYYCCQLELYDVLLVSAMSPPGIGCWTQWTVDTGHYRNWNRQKRRQRSSLLFGGQNSFNSIPHYRFRTMEDSKNRMNRRPDAWQGCFRKMDVLPKTFLQIVLAAEWPERHSSTSPKKHLCLTYCLLLLLCWTP